MSVKAGRSFQLCYEVASKLFAVIPFELNRNFNLWNNYTIGLKYIVLFNTLKF